MTTDPLVELLAQAITEQHEPSRPGIHADAEAIIAAIDPAKAEAMRAGLLLAEVAARRGAPWASEALINEIGYIADHDGRLIGRDDLMDRLVLIEAAAVTRHVRETGCEGLRGALSEALAIWNPTTREDTRHWMRLSAVLDPAAPAASPEEE